CHIAGSKGKGSTAEMVAAAMTRAGYRVGLYTSPHLSHFRQRIRIKGRSISEETLVEVFEPVREAVEKLAQEGNQPTFFDILTAAAFAAFRHQSVEMAVVETGLGGRLDSTNCLVPDVTAITSVEMDHSDKLGDTLGKIATEKAGILKEGRPLVLGPVPSEAEKAIRERAGSLGCSVRQVGRELDVGAIQPTADGSEFVLRTGRGVYGDLRIRMLGRGQVDNAAVAVGILEAWSETDSVEVSEEAIRSGLSSARLPGRLQIIREKPVVLIDGAHTASSARMLREVLEERMSYRRIFCVLAILGDKSIDDILDPLVPLCQEVMLTRAPSPRSTPPELLAKMVLKRFPWAIVHSFDEPEEAFKRALSLASDDDLVCVAGSLYLAGEAIQFFKK
ncbi:MAG: bifunctional folylpolyglutamate synthase/dihydrofolate synthase, partial [Planctomycetota bacterium]|nr:bifunctional folylpolyglutamate synthase/dihydrofolate synthase [Planctomycetota bacterium]